MIFLPSGLKAKKIVFMVLLTVILPPRGESGANTKNSSLENTEPCFDDIIKRLDPAMPETYDLNYKSHKLPFVLTILTSIFFKHATKGV